MRFAVIGNSGSGKSTLAQALALEHGIPHLDLDTVAWEKGKIAVPRDPAAAIADVERFCRENAGFVVEGCYATLIAATLAFAPRLIFLDPPVETALAHCRARPFEPHKYAAPEEQESRLPFLLEWVRGYPARAGELGRPAHLALFQAYAGAKEHRTA